ncbi:MAG: copper amine oxidase N-terminal domain-containing protein, partial [Clostridia bacterium]|nr:copper amine oxidase N-terminal domain-containing protein [Clostridia bacterium]
NGKTVELDAPAFIQNGRTYMPVRFVAEKLGATVDWDSATSTATLTK